MKYFVLLVLSSSILAIGISNCIANKLKITKNIGILGILIFSTIILWLLKLIPSFGGIFSLIYIILGLGIVLTHLILKNSKKNVEAKEEKTA